MITDKKLTKAAPSTGNDERDAAELLNLYREAQNGLRRVIALGLLCFEIQENKLPHGRFGDWVETHLPEISYRSIRAYMQLTKGVLETCGFQIGSALPLCNGGKLLLLPEGQATGKAQTLREKIFDVVDGKSARQLMFEFKQVHERGEELVPKRGRNVGEGGREAAPWNDIEALIKFNRESSLSKMGKVDQELGKLGVMFMAQPDDILIAWLGTLERTQRAVNAWLKTPLSKRNREAMEAVQKLYQQH